MSGFLKTILMAILTVAAILVFFNMAFFFPFYIEVIQTAFHVSQMISTENYLPYDQYQSILDGLRGRPIFNDRAAGVQIEARHSNGKDAIERQGPYSASGHYYYLSDEWEKPYLQMGNLVTVTVRAVYPFRMQILGRQITAADIPITFNMTTVVTRHYKDLDYDYGPYGPAIDDYDY